MYKVKEDWIFDKQRSKMDIRIIGIAPMKRWGEGRRGAGLCTHLLALLPRVPLRVQELGGVQPGERCGAPQLREHLLEAPVQQLHHQVEQRVRPPVGDYKTGIDALLQGEIESALFEFEATSGTSDPL